MEEKPFLSGHSIYLRLPKKSDILEHDWNHWYNDYILTRYNSHGIYPVSKEREMKIVEEIQERTDTILLSIAEKNTHKLLGNISLQNIDLINRRCNIAITIGEDSPITTAIEAFGLMANHAFVRLNLNRIEDSTHEDLLKLVMMLEVIGFKVDGRGKEFFLKDGVWKDKIMFSLLAADFFNLKKLRNGDILFSSKDDLLTELKKVLK
jgi:ribosomal-protein-alanine N-acetyltransferase